MRTSNDQSWPCKLGFWDFRDGRLAVLAHKRSKDPDFSLDIEDTYSLKQHQIVLILSIVPQKQHNHCLDIAPIPVWKWAFLK